MPVADKSSVVEVNLPCEEEDQLIMPQQIDPALLDNITKCLEEVIKYKEATATQLAKNAKLIKENELGRQTIAKAEAALEARRKRHEPLKKAAESKRERIKKAEEYWDDFGFDVKKTSAGKYQFIYSKLTSSDTSQYCVDVEIEGNKISCTSTAPELLSAEQLQELNSQLTPDMKYKAAMLIIRKELIKRLGS